MYHPVTYTRNIKQHRRRDLRLGVTARFFKIMLIGSLYFKFEGCKEPDLQKLTKCNSKFNIVSRVDALWIPAMSASLLWKRFDPLDLTLRIKAGQLTIAQAVTEISSHVPKFAYYEGMLQDIEHVMAECIKVT